MVDTSKIKEELENELPGIEFRVIGDGGQVTIAPKIPEDSPLERKKGKVMGAVTVEKKGNIEKAKEKIRDKYFETFTEESIKAAGGEVAEEVEKEEEGGKEVEEVETVLKDVAEDVEANKTTKANAESKATDAVLDWINEEFPGEFEKAGVDVDWQAKKYRLSARVAPSAKPEYVDYSFAHSAPIKDPGKLLTGFQELRKLLRKDLTKHPEITERLDYLRHARRSKLEAGELNIEKLLFPANEMRTVNSVSPEEVTSIFVMQGMVSDRLWAAQHVMNCEEGLSSVCAMVEDMVLAGPGEQINPSKWEALNEAWEKHEEGTFDAVSFVEKQVEFVSKEEKERKKILEAWPTIPPGWEPVSETEIERTDPDAKIEIKSVNDRYRVKATVAGEQYETREAITSGGARTDAKMLAEEINEKGYDLVSSSSKSEEKEPESSEQPSSEEKEEKEEEEEEEEPGLKEKMREKI